MVGRNNREMFAFSGMGTSSSLGLIKLILILMGLGYAGLMLFAILFANRLVFPAPKAGYSNSPDILRFPYNKSGDAVSMVLLENPGSPWLVFYQHGNGEDLQGILPRLQGLRQAGFSVLAWDYPGYGTSDGKPSEGIILDVAQQIWLKIPQLTGYTHPQVILYGRSLGGGPATFLANRHAPAGLILEGVFTSTFRVALGIRLLPWDIFDNLPLIRSVGCPVLVMHGTQDRTVPYRHGVRLYESAPQPKSFAWFDGGRHNDLIESYPETYYSSLGKFIECITLDSK